MNYILSQICICLSAIIFAASLLFKSKTKLLFVQLFASLLYCAHFYFLGVILGACFAILEFIRLCVFYVIDKRFNTDKLNLISGIIFAIGFVVVGVITFDGLISLLPMIGAVFVSLALGQKNVKIIKFCYLFQSLCIIGYLVVLQSWLGVASQILVFIGSIVGLIISYSKQNIIKDEKNNSFIDITKV